MARYQFVDHWTVKAPIDDVYRYIADVQTYPQWWPVYDTVEVVDGPATGPGGRARLTVKSALGYRLKIETEITDMTPPVYLGTVSRGQLEGTGVWELEQKGDVTYIIWTWTVESHHRLLNLLEPIAKPLFAWSHNDASEKGHQGLKRLLESRN